MNKEAEKKVESPTPEVAEATLIINPNPAYVTVSNELFKATVAQAAQAAELKDRLLRAQAEWDNSRKRILREKEDAVRYAGESFLERLLPVLDNFEMGMAAAKTATDPKAIAQGLEMVLAQFQQALHFKVDETDAQYIAAVAFATQKRWPEAIALFKRVLLVKPDFAEGHDHLASALASQGNLAAAKSQFELALTLAQAQGNNALAKAIRDEMNSATTNMVLTNSVTAPHVPAF